MIYQDPVYGKVNIKEPVIIELINSKPVQRLKKISQHGPSVYNENYKKRILTRFEHSLGVVLLLQRLNCSIEEQVAGLLHDVGHAVFSHTIDFLFPEYKGEFDKKFHKELVKNSDIPKILNKHKIDIVEVLNFNNFSVLEKDLPDLCADRVDYFLRDPFFPKKLNRKFVLNNLITVNGTLVFKGKDIAIEFSKNYLKMNHLFWARPLDEILYFLMVDIFKIGLKNKFITENDLFITEKDFLKKIKKVNSKGIKQRLYLIENLKISQIKVYKERHSNSYFIRSKIRVIDPMVLNQEKISRLSEVSEVYKKTKEEFIKNTPKERWIGYEI